MIEFNKDICILCKSPMKSKKFGVIDCILCQSKHDGLDNVYYNSSSFQPIISIYLFEEGMSAINLYDDEHCSLYINGEIINLPDNFILNTPAKDIGEIVQKIAARLQNIKSFA